MYKDIKEQVIQVCQLFVQIGLIHDTAGNISVKVKDQNETLLVVTPASFPYDVMTPDDVPVINLDGKVVEGKTKPTSETPMHLAVQRAFPDVGAVVHTHSKYATAFSIANQPLQPIHTLSLYLGGTVPVVPFRTPGTDELGEAVADTLKSGTARAALLQNHGVLTVGANLEEATYVAKFTELVAEMQHIASSVGKLTTIPEEMIAEFIGQKAL